MRTSAGTETLHAKTLAQVEFITYRESVGGEVKCGPLVAPLPVYVTWRPGAKPGERIVVAVEFLPS